MKKTRMTLLTRSLLVLSFTILTSPVAIANASESITKVGNGDDGADLENLSPINSGPIVEARKRALKLLDKLNVLGVPGLGMLTPELEKTNLLIAAKNVHPTGEKKGSLEISEDQKLVYARTFATPSADTRFFPAAKTLSSDQLVALHIHEALHRALPEGIRENEDIVTHFTLAITSNGASFDRINQVSNIYLQSNGQIADANRPKALEAQITLPNASRTYIDYQFDSYSYADDGATDSAYNMHGLEFNTSLGGYSAFMGRAVEPAIRARLKIFEGVDEKKTFGQASVDFEARVLTKSAIVGPFIRFTSKSIDESTSANINGRDLITLGGFYRADNEVSYLDANLGYSLPSSSEYSNVSINYNSILSIGTHFGFKWNNANLGALAEFHSSKGSEVNSVSTNSESPRFVVAGPEIAYNTQNLKMKIYYKKIVNSTTATMGDLGDVMDHGYGRSGYGASVTYGW